MKGFGSWLYFGSKSWSWTKSLWGTYGSHRIREKRFKVCIYTSAISLMMHNVHRARKTKHFDNYLTHPVISNHQSHPLPFHIVSCRTRTCGFFTYITPIAHPCMNITLTQTPPTSRRFVSQKASGLLTHKPLLLNISWHCLCMCMHVCHPDMHTQMDTYTHMSSLLLHKITEITV